MGAAEILAEYERLRVSKGAKPWHMTPKKTASAAERFEQWCIENQISDPIAFMRSRFEAFPKGSFPSLLSMRSVVALDRWRQFREGEQLEGKRYERLKSRMPTAREAMFKKLAAEPTKTQESIRLDYATTQKHSLCMLESEYSGGYDPRSQVCPRCPIKHECLRRLNYRYGFDVGALRVGLISRLPPEVATVARNALDRR